MSDEITIIVDETIEKVTINVEENSENVTINIDETIEDVTINIDELVTTWGEIYGTLVNQLDLIEALNNKSDITHNHNLNDLSEKSYDSLDDKPTIPDELSDLSDDENHRTVTDNQIDIWTAKQDALGYTPVPDTRTINSYSLTNNIELTKTDIGLGNVDNTSDLDKPINTLTQTALDNKSNITHNHNLADLLEKSYNSLDDKPIIPDELSDLLDDSEHRIVTDTEKSTWNNKQDALGFTPENVANRLSAFQGTPDNSHYVTEKLIKDSLDSKSDITHNHNLNDLLEKSYNSLDDLPPEAVMTYDNFIYFTPSGAGDTTVLDITGSGEIFIALAQVYSDTRTIKVTIDGGSENTFDSNVNAYNPFSFFFKFNSSIKIVVATTVAGTPAFNAWYGLRS